MTVFCELTQIFTDITEFFVKNMKYNYLIVGAGLFGATFAYKARQAGKKFYGSTKRISAVLTKI